MPHGGLLGYLSGTVNEVTGDASGEDGFPRTLKTAHFMDADVALTPGEDVKLGEFIVPAQQKYHFGQGAAKFEANQGYLFVDVRDNAAAPGAQLDGSVRLQQRDANEWDIKTVYNNEVEVLRASKSDRNSKEALPLQDGYPKVGHQSKLVVTFDSETAVTAGSANTEMLIPVTVYRA